jgi:hypothetical protein
MITVLPRRRNSAAMLRIRPHWLTLPVIPIKSASMPKSIGETFSSQSRTSKSLGASAATVAIARSAIDVAGAKPQAPNTSALK